MKAFGFALAITAAMCATAFAQEEDTRFRLQDQNSEKEPDNVSNATVQPVRFL
jgi:TRAP-type C4-dicarboxylate transport system substrate-binding protein